MNNVMLLSFAGTVLSAFALGYVVATYRKTKQIWDMQEHHEAQLEKMSANLRIGQSANNALRADLEKHSRAVEGYQREIAGLVEELNDVNVQLQHYKELSTKTAPVVLPKKKRSSRPGKAARAAAKRRRDSTHDLIVTGHSINMVSAQGVSHVPTESYYRLSRSCCSCKTS